MAAGYRHDRVHQRRNRVRFAWLAFIERGVVEFAEDAVGVERRWDLRVTEVSAGPTAVGNDCIGMRTRSLSVIALPMLPPCSNEVGTSAETR